MPPSSKLHWVLWCCPECRKTRYTIEWWAEAGSPYCHHGKRGHIGTFLNPIPLAFNPVEEAWYGDADE